MANAGTIWITGASSGIGAAVAREMDRRGWLTALTARGEDAPSELAGELRSAVALPGDVTDRGAMHAVAAAAETALGPIDVALLNAGNWEPIPADRFSVEPLRRQVDTMVLGTANCIEAVLPRMIDRGRGRLAVSASVAGYWGLPLASAYGGAKAFLIAMCDSLRAGLRGRDTGVEVTVIAPGFVRTPLVADNDFPMPAMVSAEEAARRIADGIERSRPHVAFPRRPAAAMRALAVAPGPLRRWAVARIARRRAREEREA